MSNFKVGDVVQNEWRETYDREWDNGVIVEAQEDDHYKVARIGRDEEGYYWTNQWEIRSADRLRPASIKLEDTGLKV